MTVKVKGVPINLDGQDFIVPPLNLNSLQQFQEEIKSLSTEPNLKTLNLVVDLAHAALKRNYPEMEKSFLTEHIDLGNFIDVLDAVMGATGLVKQKAMEAMAADGQ